MHYCEENRESPTLTIVIDGSTANKLFCVSADDMRIRILPKLLGVDEEDVKRVSFEWKHDSKLSGKKTITYDR